MLAGWSEISDEVVARPPVQAGSRTAGESRTSGCQSGQRIETASESRRLDPMEKPEG